MKDVISYIKKIIKRFVFLSCILLTTLVTAQDFITTWSTSNSNETITIPTLGAGYNYDIDWDNDGIFDDLAQTGDASHEYETSGIKTIVIRGDFPRIYFNNVGDKDKIITIEQWGDIAWTSMNNAFNGCINLTVNATDTPNLTLVTDLSAMFSGCRNFNTNISSWDVSTITDMTNLFANATSFNQDIGSWDVSNVTSMAGMFLNGAISTNNYDNILIGWEQLTLQSDVVFDVGNSTYCNGNTPRTDIMSNYNWTINDGGLNCDTGFITRWNTSNSGTSASNQITIPIVGSGYDYNVDWGDGNIDLNLTTETTHTYTNEGVYTVIITGDFSRIYFNNEGDKDKLLSIEQWDVISWTSMNAAFYGCENLVINAIDAPDLSLVTDMNLMFSGASKLNQNIGGWDVSSVTNMSEVFSNANSFNQDISGWDVTNVTTMDGMFANTPFNQPIGGWAVGNVLNMDGMFSSASAFNQDISSWDVNSVISMEGMFSNASVFNQGIGGWDVINVISMVAMFTNATKFNQDISGWDVTNVIDMNLMFAFAEDFNQPIGNWTVTNVTDMNNMFNGATAFNQDISSWDVSAVTNMSGMFKQASAFNQDIGGWVVGSVINMTEMFSNAEVFNQDIGSWDVTLVTNMDAIFNIAIDFDQDLGSWNIINVTSMDDMFEGVTLSISNYDNLLIGWNGLTVQSGVVFNGGNSRYCNGEIARNSLIANDGWIIQDAGAENIAPVLNAVSLPDLTDECEITNPTAPTATDDCKGLITGVANVTFPYTTQGTTVVTWTFDDSNGNITTQNQNIILNDTTDPTITCVADISVNNDPGSCSAIVTWAPITGNDNCASTVTSTHSSGETFPIGITEVIFTITDAGGRIAECSFNVTVTDTEAPILTACPGPITIDSEPGVCGATVSWSPPVGSDNCSFILASSHNPGDVFPLGTTTVFYTAQDNSGNAVTCSFDITVSDDENPVFSNCPSNFIVSNNLGSCNATVFWTAPTASDNCTTSVSSTHNPGDSFPIGITTVTYAALDASGNTNTCSFNVEVIDSEMPVISSCPFNITTQTDPGSCSTTVSWNIPLESDNCGVTMTSTHNPGDIFTSGITTVVYTAVDSSGNSTTCSFDVIVNENEAPVLSNCPSNIIVTNQPGNCSAQAFWTPPSQTDNCGATLNTTHNPGDVFSVGTTMVTYTATDASGNSTSCNFNVIVQDIEAPSIIGCPTNISTINDIGNCGAIVTWTTPIAVDNCSAILSATHNSGDTFPLGTTIVIYTAIDAEGNTVNCSFNVTVIDQEAPVFTGCLSDILISNDFGDCNANVSWTPPTALDNCINLTLTSTHTSGDMFSIGTTTVIYTATDFAGNSATCSFNVIVEDTEAPDIDCPTNTTVFVGGDPYEIPDYFGSGLATVIDNCTDPITITSQDPVAGSQLVLGVYTVTLMAEDQYGNESMCSFQLTVDQLLNNQTIDFDLSTVLLFPNPADSYLTLSNPQLVPLKKVTIYDLTGRLIRTIDLSNMNLEKKIDISKLASANYILIIKAENGQTIKQLIKE
jgi:surface protein